MLISQLLCCSWSSKNESHLNMTRTTQKTHDFASTVIQPTKYQHVNHLGRTQGPAQTTKITPGDTPRGPSVFSMLASPSLGSPWDLLRTAQGPPKRSQGTSEDPQGFPKHDQALRRDLQRPPSFLRDPAEAQRSFITS